MWDLAMRLWQAGNYEEAKKQLINIIEQVPDDAQAYYRIGCCDDKLGQPSEAIPSYEKALSLGFDEVGVYIGLGRCYRAIGRHEDARRILEKGRERFPEYHALPPFLALVYYDLKLYAEATKLLVHAYVAASNDQDVQLYSRAMLADVAKVMQKE